jgi:hypothetical protein
MSIDWDALDAFDEHEDTNRTGYLHAPTKYCGNKKDSLPFILPQLPSKDENLDLRCTTIVNQACLHSIV